MALTLADLLPTLVTATDERKVSWTQAYLDASKYEASLPKKHRASIAFWSDSDTDSSGHTLALYREPHTDDAIDEMITNQYSPYNDVLRNLFNSARRNAKNVDQSIKDIMAELDDIPF